MDIDHIKHCDAGFYLVVGDAIFLYFKIFNFFIF